MEQFIIYGAGKKGKNIYGFLKEKGLGSMVYCFADQNAHNIKAIDGIKVFTFEETVHLDYPYIVGVNTASIDSEMKAKLKAANKIYYNDLSFMVQYAGKTLDDWNREYCAYSHINFMDSYFDNAENDEKLQIFWGENSPFYRLFQKLDLNNVIELACGRGRHAEIYGKWAKNITLVDVLEKNIAFCRERFKDRTNIAYYCNNGQDLGDLADSAYTSLFTYDSMVHFEMMDIVSYLKDIRRVLVPGCYALFHHSNNMYDYKASYANAPHGRSFMSADIFAHVAFCNGFEVVEQKVIDWKECKNIDCITLLQKI